MSADAGAVRAIDVHVHAEASVTSDPAARKLPGTTWPAPTAEDVAVKYRALGMLAVVFPLDAQRTTGVAPVPNEEVAEIAAANPDVLIPFASLDPYREGAAAEARRLVERFGVRGFKFHPSLQEFFADDRAVYPLYQELEALGVVALFHTGQTAAGNARLKFNDPIHLDDVAADFPDLRIVMAHPSFPWQDVALSIASHREHVYIDLSGWSPKYFPETLVHYSNTLIRDKVLFGSDFPVIDPERWIADFRKAPFRDEVRQGILKDNAVRLLGLDTGG